MPMWKYENKHSLWHVLALFHFYDDNANEDDDDDDNNDDDDDDAGALGLSEKASYPIYWSILYLDACIPM